MFVRSIAHCLGLPLLLFCQDCHFRWGTASAHCCPLKQNEYGRLCSPRRYSFPLLKQPGLQLGTLGNVSQSWVCLELWIVCDCERFMIFNIKYLRWVHCFSTLLDSTHWSITDKLKGTLGRGYFLDSNWYKWYS